MDGKSRGSNLPPPIHAPLEIIYTLHKRNPKMFTWLKEIFSGFIVGIANIIPGVSGGTLLFLLGLYERTINAINNIKPGAILTLLRRQRGKTRVSGLRRNTFMDEANILGFPFLARLIIGAGAAILLFSGLMKYMLDKHFTNTFAFFFGLIAVSAVLSIKTLNKVRPILIIHFIIGAAVTVGVTAAVDPAVNAKQKSEHYMAILESNAGGPSSSESVSAKKGSSSTVSTKKNLSTVPAKDNSSASSTTSTQRFKYTGRYTPYEMAFGAIAGAIAVSAMILPGLSGSLVLILLGQYYEVISAISGLKSLQFDYFVFLTAVGLGMLLGILAFARIIKFVFERFYNGTVAVLIGLTAGSLYALCPFKKIVMMDLYAKSANGIALFKDVEVQTNANILPADMNLILPALLFCGIGVAVMVVLDKYGAER
jgi:putative membrane protein